VNRFGSLTDAELSEALAEKIATVHNERATAALLGAPAHFVLAKQIEKEIAELKAEQSKRIAR
jgi:hypothetical protein